MNIKNEHGITLLALIVTVIVMVILASIAISASVGDNGLIKQTKTSTIKASVREVEEALDAYLLLKDKEKIQNGDLSGVKLIDIAGNTDNKLLSSPDTTTKPGYNIYIVKDVTKLNIKGDYGKGSTTDVFKVQEDANTHVYKVFYVSSEGTAYEG